MDKNRRIFFKRLLSAGIFLGGGGLTLIGCGGNGGNKNSTDDTTGSKGGGEGTSPDGDSPNRFGGNCDDFSKLTDGDYEVREQLGYEMESPTPELECQHCNLWLPPRENETCGGCTLFTGPIEPKGTCTYWAPRQ